MTFRLIDCRTCQGSGAVRTQVSTDGGQVRQSAYVCPSCRGTGVEDVR